jgi:hypothetical protein
MPADPDHSARLAWARQHDPGLFAMIESAKATANRGYGPMSAWGQERLDRHLSTLDQRYREAHAGPPEGWGHAELVAEVGKLTTWRDDLLRMAGVTEDLRPEMVADTVVGLLQKAMNTFAEARAAHERTHALAPALRKACDELERYIGSDIPLTRETKAALPEWRRLAEGR